MKPEAFFAAIAPMVKDIEAALDKEGRPGLPPNLVMAQAAIETGWNPMGCNQGMPGWRGAWNFSGISNAGKILNFASVAQYVAAYVRTIALSYYTGCFTEDAVAAATALGASNWRTYVPLAERAAMALGASPWAGSHYELPGGEPGSALAEIISQYSGEMEQAYTGTSSEEEITVAADQTLSEIADEHHETLSTIEAANPQITNPNYITPGERLIIDTSAASGSTKIPSVQPSAQPADSHEATATAATAKSETPAAKKTVDEPASQEAGPTAADAPTNDEVAINTALVAIAVALNEIVGLIKEAIAAEKDGLK